MRRELGFKFLSGQQEYGEMRHELRHDMKKANEEIQEVRRVIG